MCCHLWFIGLKPCGYPITGPLWAVFCTFRDDTVIGRGERRFAVRSPLFRRIRITSFAIAGAQGEELQKRSADFRRRFCLEFTNLILSLLLVLPLLPDKRRNIEIIFFEGALYIALYGVEGRCVALRGA
jgi:hypothetical protein